MQERVSQVIKVPTTTVGEGELLAIGKIIEAVNAPPFVQTNIAFSLNLKGQNNLDGLKVISITIRRANRDFPNAITVCIARIAGVSRFNELKKTADRINAELPLVRPVVDLVGHPVGQVAVNGVHTCNGAITIQNPNFSCGTTPI